jgi:hypothetical protein
MKPTLPLVVAILGVLAGPALAQDGPEPPALELPVGARVRIRTVASAHWIEGFLASADAGTVSLVPEEAPPLGDNRLRLPTGDVARLEVLTARKRQWLPGLVAGAALGLAAGATVAVDPTRCGANDDAFCSRGEAVAAMGSTLAVIGTLVGGAVRKSVWTPVALDALGAPSGRGSATGLQLQAVPGGVGVAMTVRF